jgi:hypothetical protein
MTDDELRSLVRDAIARHLGGQRAGVAQGPPLAPPQQVQTGRSEPPWRAHPSFAKLLNLPGDDDSGPCMIEPSVQCNHCNFCKSYGH